MKKLRLYNGNIQRIVVKMAEMKMQILYDKISNRNY